MGFSLVKRMQRLLLRTLKCQMDVKYRSGGDMTVADALSRAYVPDTEADD